MTVVVAAVGTPLQLAGMAVLGAAGFLTVFLIRRPRRQRGYAPFYLIPSASADVIDDPVIDWRGGAWAGVQKYATLRIRLCADADRLAVSGLSIGGTWVADRPDVAEVRVAKGWQNPSVDVVDHDGARAAITFLPSGRTVEEVVDAFTAAGWPCRADTGGSSGRSSPP